MTIENGQNTSDSYSVVSADTAQAGFSNVAHAQSGILE